MAEQWIEASRALELAGSTYALCERASAGLVKSRAQLLLIGNDRHEDAVIPSKFWWAEGHEALDQDWASGDFSTWIDRSVEWKAFGVTFALPGVLEMLPPDRRGVVTRSLSVASNPDWVSAKEARRIAYDQGRFSPVLAGFAIIQQARLGFVTARAVLAQGSKAGRYETHWSWELREWDVAPWFWEKFTDSNSSSQNWELGKFSGKGIAPDGLRYVTLSGLHFLKETLDSLLPTGRAHHESSPVAKNSGGRPAAAWWDDLWCAIWGLIHQGDFKPNSQADVERAMLHWATANGHDISESTVKPKARKLFHAYSNEVENFLGG